MDGSTADIRAEWRGVLDRHRGRSWKQPDGERFWSQRLETASADELRAIQSEKLRVAVRYAYACIPFYRQKFDAIGLRPADVTSVDDLEKIPVTTKQEMAEDIAAHPPWGTYTAVDDAIWAERGWQIFASSGTTARPRVFRYTSLDRSLWSWGNARAMWAMGVAPAPEAAGLRVRPARVALGRALCAEPHGHPHRDGGRPRLARPRALRPRVPPDHPGLHALLCALPRELDGRSRPRPGGQRGALPLLRRRAGLQRPGHASPAGGA